MRHKIKITTISTCFSVLTLATSNLVLATGKDTPLSTENLDSISNNASTVRQLSGRNTSTEAHTNVPTTTRNLREFRSFDGSGNNLAQPQMNRAHTRLRREFAADYQDLVSDMAEHNRPSARMISNAMSDQALATGANTTHPRIASDYLWQWGQFLDHDISLTDADESAQAIPIAIPRFDAHFDPRGTGTATMSMNRSLHDHDSGTSANNPREQINEISGWIDASMVYGSDAERARLLRKRDGSGELLMSSNDLLPFNHDGLRNAGGDSARLFVAGDVRANEQTGLAAMHTLLAREHNRLARGLRASAPSLDGDTIYLRARRHVAALIQHITYNEFLPTLLGRNALPRYRGYDASVDARIANAFSTAAYRFGHSMLSPQILRVDANVDADAHGHLRLRDAFFAPHRLTAEGGIESILRGLAMQPAQRLDAQLVDDVRNFLFGPPGAGGFDLAALNIQRGRDHGLPGYAAARAKYNLGHAESFLDLPMPANLQQQLASVYASVDAIDLWVGGLAETPQGDSMLGPLFHTIVADQFTRLRDGDRFWYERILSGAELAAVRATTLASLIKRNTTIEAEMAADVFTLRSLVHYDELLANGITWDDSKHGGGESHGDNEGDDNGNSTPGANHLGGTIIASHPASVRIDGRLQDWNGISVAAQDPRDARSGSDRFDYHRVWMAHDPDHLLIRFANHAPHAAQLSWGYAVAIDIDGNASGYRGVNRRAPVRVDYLVEANSVYRYSGNGDEWSWQWVGNFETAFAGVNAELAIPRTFFGNPGSINLFMYADNRAIGGNTVDYLPDAVADRSAATERRFFHYNFDDVDADSQLQAPGGTTVWSNPVLSLRIDGSPADWHDLVRFPVDGADAQESGALDYEYAAAAHNEHQLFLHWRGSQAARISWGNAIFIDSDQRRGTGFQGFSNESPIGIDFLLEADDVYRYSGNGSNWAWQWVGNSEIATAGNEAEMAVNFALLGNPIAFDLFFYADSTAVSSQGIDFYPQQAVNTDAPMQQRRFRYSRTGGRTMSLKTAENQEHATTPVASQSTAVAMPNEALANAVMATAGGSASLPMLLMLLLMGSARRLRHASTRFHGARLGRLTVRVLAALTLMAGLAACGQSPSIDDSPASTVPQTTIADDGRQPRTSVAWQQAIKSAEFVASQQRKPRSNALGLD